MAPYTARTGGIFGSGLYQNSRPQVDVGGAIDAVSRGATSLIEQAYQRRLADNQRQIQANELARQHSREDVLDQRAAAEFSMRQDEHNAAMAASGYTPEHSETRTAVEPGNVESNGLMGGPGKVTGPSLRTQATTIPGAYDFRKSAAYQISSDVRNRKASEFSAVYKKNFPGASDTEAMEAGFYAADNPSIADNILFPPRDPTATYATNRNYAITHPLPGQGRGSANSAMGKALSTANTQVDDAARESARAHGEVTKRYPGGLSDAEDAADSANYQKLRAADSTSNVNYRRVSTIRDALASRQLKDAGLENVTSDSTATTKTKSAAPSEQLVAWRKAAAALKRKGKSASILGPRPTQ